MFKTSTRRLLLFGFERLSRFSVVVDSVCSTTFSVDKGSAFCWSDITSKICGKINAAERFVKSISFVVVFGRSVLVFSFLLP